MNVLVSACLMGDPVRYDGKSKFIQGIETLKQTHELFKWCPEVTGGLPVPREPAEIQGSSMELFQKGTGGVFTKSGKNVTDPFLQGAHKTLEFCLENGIKAAVLKERSPSCGLDEIYDGSHSGRVITGTGITAMLLRQNGIRIYTEKNFMELLEGN